MTLPPARYIAKDESTLMRAIGAVLSPFNDRFMESYFTTIGQTIYLPRKVKLTDPEWTRRWGVSLAHEDDHRALFHKWGVIPLGLFYLFFPIPIGLCWGRWVVERRAYLLNILAHPREERRAVIDRIVNQLCGPGYLYTWPKSWARKWFLSKVET